MDALARALAAFPLADPRTLRIPHGLVNESFAVRDGDVEYVLQRVSPIFQSGIHENLRAVTEHLASRGLATQRLVPTREGRLFADCGEDGRWRLLARLPGVTFDVCGTIAQAESAGALVGRFHAALADFGAALRPLGIPLHDTPAYLGGLERALAAHPDHRLAAEVAPLAAEILAAASGCVPPPALPVRVIHGDLKFNNVLFAGTEGPARERAVALIDLDTVSRLPLWTELGDAWRSWCNRAGEDSPEAELDLECLRAAAGSYLAACGLELGRAERDSLVLGPERVTLELAARFAADALVESYFRFDPARFASRGEHNLVRARGQLSLARQLRDSRPLRARMVA